MYPLLCPNGRVRLPADTYTRTLYCLAAVVLSKLFFFSSGRLPNVQLSIDVSITGNERLCEVVIWYENLDPKASSQPEQVHTSVEQVHVHTPSRS